MVLFLGLVGAAFAEPDPWAQSLRELAPKPHLRLSTELAANPATAKTVARANVGLTVAYLPNPWFAVELGAAYSPHLSNVSNRGRLHFRRAPGDLKLAYIPVTMVARSQAMAVFTPVQGRFSSRLGTTFGIDLGLGFGLVYTEDDVDALGGDGGPEVMKTANQLHPTLAWMAGPRIGIRRGWSVTVRLRGTHWIETIESVVLERIDRVEGVVGVARDF